MNIIEKLIESKTIDINNCEDGLFINENFIAVIDGAKSKGTMIWDGKVGGRYIKDIISATLPKLDGNINVEEAMKILNIHIKIAYKDKYEFIKTNVAERLEASIIIYSKTKKEIWNLGDCQCIINNQLYSHDKKIDIVVSEFRSLCNKLSLLEGKTTEDIMKNDIGRELILPIIKKQALLANSSDQDYSYGVLDGYSINLNKINVYKVQEGDEIILASDGYPQLKNTLEASERILKETLESDKLLINNFKATKCFNNTNNSFDDRTYIRFII